MTDAIPYRSTTDGLPPDPGMEKAGAPKPINPATGQHAAYYVLSDAERAKGFIRPVRAKYVHTGEKPQHPLRPLTDEERHERKVEEKYGYVCFEAYPESESAVTGRYWTRAQINGGCGALTSMSRDIAETYARDPKFYGSTFCCGCKKHLPVAEFTWDDGSDTKVGS